MKGRLCGLALLCCVVSTPSHATAAQIAPATPGWLSIDLDAPKDRPEPTPSNIAAGKRLYNFRCSPCHGVDGDGEGPVAKYLDPRPRDFTLALFKMRTTASGELALDSDLFRTITRGVPGTAMPSWAPLPVAERWKIIYYLKTFAADYFDDPEMDPRRTEDGETFLIDVPEPPPFSEELLARGKNGFEHARCHECHGKRGLGNGTSAGKQGTAKRHRILPRDLSKGWKYKGGTGVRDIWKTLTAGMNGTPMPSFMESLDEKDPEKDAADRWAVAYYVRSLLHELDDAAEMNTVLHVHRVDAGVPTDPDDPVWDTADALEFRMFGQVTRRPRWQIPAVDHVQVRALYDGDKIAVRLEYHDRFKNTEHVDADILSEPTNYPELDVETYEDKLHTFRDAVAVQFPIKPTTDATRPYFLYGGRQQPVVLWRYHADEDGFVEIDAKGADKIVHRDRATNVTGTATFDDGVWTVVMTRRLAVEGKDVTFEPGRIVPFSIMAWDGGNGESGLRQSLSSWYAMQLDAPIPARAWALGALGLILTGLAEVLLVRRARREATRA